MRITNASISRNYTNNLNRNLELLNKANMRVMTGRKYDKMYEDVASGVRAMNIRRSLSLIDGYLDNAEATKHTFAGAEKTLLQIGEINKDIMEGYTNALNATTANERDVFATQFEKLREEILSCMNGQFSDRYLFGGTNTQTRPFTVDDNGKLLYNGVDVTTITDRSDPAFAYLFGDASYVDIGLGLTMEGSPGSQKPVENSALKNSFVGIDFLGFGDNNLYNIIGEMITALRSPDFNAETGGPLLEKFKSAANEVNLQVTRLGSDTQFLDFTISRLKDEALTLDERQQSLEFSDPASLILDFQMQQYIYNAALQMGQRLLQPTLFNFIN